MLVAIGLSVAELLVRVARPHDAILGLVPGLAGMHDVDDYPGARTIPGLVVYRYDAPLFFANAEDFRRRALAAADRGPGPLRWFVLNVEANVEVDFTALEALDAVREEIAGKVRSSPSPGSNRTCWPGCDPSAWPTRSGRSGSSRPCPPRCRPTRNGPGSKASRATMAPRTAEPGSGMGAEPVRAGWPRPGQVQAAGPRHGRTSWAMIAARYEERALVTGVSALGRACRAPAEGPFGR